MRKPRRMFILTFIVLIAILVVCLKTCDTRLWMLKSRKITYNELPDSVKSVLYAAAFKDPAYLTIDNDTIIQDYMLLGNPADTSVYYLKTFNFKIAPWIYYCKLINKKKNIIYRMPVKLSGPLLVFKDRLYIPVENDPSKEDIYKTMYTEYELK